MTDKITVSPERAQGMNIFQRMFCAAQQLGFITKDGDNTQQKFRFASHDAVVGECRKAFLDWGILCVNSVQESARELRTVKSQRGDRDVFCAWLQIQTTLINPDDPKDQFYVRTETEAQDSGDKAYGKAISYAKKYALLTGCGLMLETGEDIDKPANRELGKASKLFASIAMKVGAPSDWQCEIIDSADPTMINNEAGRLKDLHGVKAAYKADCKAKKIPQKDAEEMFLKAMKDNGLIPLYVQNPGHVQRALDAEMEQS